MKYSLILILSLLFTAQSLLKDITYYSIDSFIKEMEAKGYLELLVVIKKNYGIDVTIEFMQRINTISSL